jgi:transcriptional regulator with XRE-family HTH domain
LKGARNLAGPILRKLRLAQRLSQAELAARCQRHGWDVSREMVNHIEMQVRVLREYEIVALSKALGIPSSKLLPGEKEAFQRLAAQ